MLAFVLGARLSVHNPLEEMLWHVMMVCPFCWMWSAVLPNVGVRPWSQNYPIEMRDAFWSWAKICALRAVRGRLGMSKKRAVGGADTLAFDKPTLIPCVVGVLLIQGLLAKCPMHPVSIVMVLLVGLSEAGVKTGAIQSIA